MELNNAWSLCRQLHALINEDHYYIIRYAVQGKLNASCVDTA